MIDDVEAGLKFDRVFSVNLDYLAPALVDMRLHEIEDAKNVDCVAVKLSVLAELGMPQAIDPMMTVTNAYHTWTESYAPELYVYLWADVIVADISNAFAEAPGGFFDVELSKKYRSEVLSSANVMPVDASFRCFRGREPDALALLKRFELVE